SQGLVDRRGVDRARLDDADVHALGPQLQSERGAHRRKCRLGAGEGSRERGRDVVADGTAVDDASLRHSYQGQQRLNNGDLPEQVHFVDRAEGVERSVFRGKDVADPGVVEESIEAAVAEPRGDVARGGGDRVLVGDVEVNRLDRTI